MSTVQTVRIGGHNCSYRDVLGILQNRGKEIRVESERGRIRQVLTSVIVNLNEVGVNLGGLSLTSSTTMDTEALVECIPSLTLSCEERTA